MGLLVICIIVAITAIIIDISFDSLFSFVIGIIFATYFVVIFISMVSVIYTNESFHDKEILTRELYIATLEKENWIEDENAIDLIIDIKEWNDELISRNHSYNNILFRGLNYNTTDIEPIDLSKYLVEGHT